MSPGNYSPKGRSSLLFLENVDRSKLTAVLGTENIRTIAVILNSCNHLLSAKILAGLPDVIQKQAVSAMKSAKDTPGDIIDELAKALKEKLAQPIKNDPKTEALSISVMAEDKISYGGPETAAAILKYCNSETRNLIKNSAPELFTKLNSMLFTFDDFINTDDKSIQVIFSQISIEKTALALKVSTPALRTKITTNLSLRKKKAVADEIAASNRISIKDIEEAQKAIIDYAFNLQAKGLVILDEESETT